MNKLPFEAKVYQRHDSSPETWCVEAIDIESGNIFIAEFSNDCSKKFAIEYASEKYQHFSFFNVQPQ
jgi:hypothetical protein